MRLSLPFDARSSCASIHKLWQLYASGLGRGQRHARSLNASSSASRGTCGDAHSMCIVNRLHRPQYIYIYFSSSSGLAKDVMIRRGSLCVYVGIYYAREEEARSGRRYAREKRTPRRIYMRRGDTFSVAEREREQKGGCYVAS